MHIPTFLRQRAGPALTDLDMSEGSIVVLISPICH